MKAKKSKKVDLEGKKGIFLQIGILIALSVVYMAFEWNTKYNEVSELTVIRTGDDFEDEIINTYVEPVKKKPLPKKKEIVIVEDEVDEPIIY
jgi:protein TonB